MKNLFKSFWIVAMTALLVTAPLAATTLKAAPLKPSVVVSVSSIDDVLDNVSRLAKLSGNGDSVQMLRLMSSMYTVGIDTKRPIGVAMMLKKSEEQQPDVLAFVPVTDLKTQLTALEDQLGEAEELENGILGFKNDIYVKEQGKWAFVATTKDLLKNLPAKPTTMLGDLHKKYAIGVQLNVQNIPKELRDKAIEAMTTGYRDSMAQDASGEDAKVQKELGDLQLENMLQLAKDVKSVTMGLAFDKSEEATAFEVEMEMLKETKTAAQLSRVEKMTNRFAGFVPADAAITLATGSRLSDEDISKTVSMLTLTRKMVMSQLKKDPPAEMPEGAPMLIGELIDVMTATVEGGTFDMAGSVTLNDDTACAVGAVTVANPNKLEESFRKMIKLGQEESEDFPEVKLNAETYKGIKFHKMVIPVEEAQPQLVLGETVSMYFGFGKGAFYFAAGKNAMQTLKKSIETSEGKKAITGPMDMKVRGGKIAKFAVDVNENPRSAAWAEALAETPGNDAFSIKATVAGTTLKYRIQLDDGIIRAAGRAQQAESDL